MVLTIKNRAIYYKRFEKDIWGIMRTTYPVPFVKKRKYKNWKLDQLRIKRNKDLGITKITKKLRLLLKTKKLTVKQKKYLIKINFQKNSTIIYPWEQKSNKIARILNFFFQLNEIKRKNRAKNKQPYIYRLDIIERRQFKRKLKYRFVSLRLVKLFYINYSYRMFRLLAKRMQKTEGMFEWNFLLKLEGRLMSFIYRTSLVSNLFQCIQLIKQGFICASFKNIIYPNYNVQVGEFVTFNSLGKKLVYIMLIKRLSKKLSLFNPPGYIYVSYKFLYSYMKRPPLKKQLVFPVALDLYRATGYAF